MLEKMSVGLVSRTFFNVPLWAAMENGRFAAEGIEVVPTILGSTSRCRRCSTAACRSSSARRSLPCRTRRPVDPCV